MKKKPLDLKKLLDLLNNIYKKHGNISVEMMQEGHNIQVQSEVMDVAVSSTGKYMIIIGHEEDV